ncbi:TetR/AcrR family transcriptional regulator [Paenibacillus sp. N1-5-1-14]|uniref:TetR/AcrR family transcriptional regulator n=1 Tax=Paenibacillus radicibacter TaxID=2972488 RepID=UPI0021591CBC|nr:TetR/AcrR family transcriptional regulator [Paenibacillus radicibacter]MCR8642544.1 TetR/AcrR family transcriptional regulator [Paenibacillus radicibacter]
MNKYEMTTEKKKKAIIQAAMTLFKENGFTSVSIKEIAALAHVSQVSIYNYFGSKEALIVECADIIMSDTLQKAGEILTKNISFVEKLESALLLCTEHINLSISEYFSQKALGDPVLVDLLSKSINEKKRKIYCEYIEAGKRENMIDGTIPTETYLAFIDALNMLGSRLEFNDDISTAIKHIHHLYLYGIIGKA